MNPLIERLAGIALSFNIILRQLLSHAVTISAHAGGQFERPVQFEDYDAHHFVRKLVRISARFPFSEAVRDGRPTFRWRPVAGADGYRVFVRDASGHTLLDEDAGNRTELPWPAGQPPLNPGGRYDWQVAARVGARFKVSPWDSFAVLGEAQQRQVAELVGHLANQPLALAAIDESFGLYDEAASQLRNLQAEYPGDNRPQQMLDSLIALRKATR
jgi:hypothetical protein